MCIDTIDLRYIGDIYLNLKFSKRPFVVLLRNACVDESQ